MSYAEFPSSILRCEDSDHHELIEFYIEVRDKYEGTLNDIARLSRELDEYRRSVQIEIGSSVELAVSKAMSDTVQEINSEINSMKFNITNLTHSLDALRNDHTRDITNINNSISELNSSVTNINKQLITLTNTLRNEYIQADTKIKNDLEKLITEGDENLQRLILDGDKDTLSKSTDYSYRLMQTTKRELEDEISKISTESGRNAIKWLWQYGCCAGGFTAREWYHLTNIKASCWNKVSPTAWEWYTNGIRLFKRFTRIMKMYSPVTGELVDVRLALAQLAGKLKVNGITASEYDNLDIHAGEYDNLNIEAGEYDWNGKEVLNAQFENRNVGITDIHS